MPEVKSAREATEIAVTFIKGYYSYAKPIKAVREGNNWLVEIDTGVVVTKITKVKIDVKTGDILEYIAP